MRRMACSQVQSERMPTEASSCLNASLASSCTFQDETLQSKVTDPWLLLGLGVLNPGLPRNPKP